MVDGTYTLCSLNVEIVQGGPQVSNCPLLPTGTLDFLMTGNLLLTFDNVENKVLATMVAAIFQRDHQAIFAHAG